MTPLRPLHNSRMLHLAVTISAPVIAASLLVSMFSITNGNLR